VDLDVLTAALDLHEGALEAAEKDLEAAGRALAGEPPAPLLAARGLLLLARSREADAAAALERARALADARDALELFPPPALDEALARALTASGRAHDAVVVLDRALANARPDDHTPGTARLRLARARARLEVPDADGAIADYEAARAVLAVRDESAAREPALARAYVARGKARLAAWDEKVAAVAFQRAAELDRTVFDPALAKRAAEVLEMVSILAIRNAASATDPTDRPTADGIRAAHATLDLALELDPSRPKAPAELVQVEKIMCSPGVHLPAVRFLVAARFRRLGIPFDAHNELFMFEKGEGSWGVYEDKLRKDIALANGDVKRLVVVYRSFSHYVARQTPEVAYEGEEELKAICPKERWHEWCIARARTLMSLGRKDESVKLFDEAVERASKLGPEEQGDAWFWRGSYMKTAGRWDQVVHDLREWDKCQRASGKPPTNGWGDLSLAEGLHNLGRDAEAQEELAAARKLGGIDDVHAAKIEAAIKAALGKK
jgi:hypothetical protein